MQGRGAVRDVSCGSSGQGRALRVTVVRALHFCGDTSVRCTLEMWKTKKSRSRRRADDSYFPAMAIQLPISLRADAQLQIQKPYRRALSFTKVDPSPKRNPRSRFALVLPRALPPRPTGFTHGRDAQGRLENYQWREDVYRASFRTRYSHQSAPRRTIVTFSGCRDERRVRLAGAEARTLPPRVIPIITRSERSTYFVIALRRTSFEHGARVSSQSQVPLNKLSS